MSESSWKDGPMTRAEFDAQRDALRCPFCASGNIGTIPAALPHDSRAVCFNCDPTGKYIRWLRKDDNGRRVKAPSSKGTAEVWALFGEHCVCCGIHEEHLAVFALHKTVQHVQQYRYKGHEADCVPFCSGCQSIATERNRRNEAALKYLAKLKPISEWVKGTE